MPSGKQATLIVWFVGMSVLIGLTVWYGADHVGTAIVSAGWASVLVVIARVAAVAVAGAGWWLLFRHEQRPSGPLRPLPKERAPRWLSLRNASCAPRA